MLNPFILFPGGGGGGGFDPFVAPTAPSTGSATISTTAANINTISPTAGDIVLLTASATLTSGKTVSNWTGTAVNPIILLCNGFGWLNRTLTFDNCQFVRFFDISVTNSTGNGLVLTRCRDCCFVNTTVNNSGSNGFRVLGSTPYSTANARLRFFNTSIDTWSGSDGFTFHADPSANNIGTDFIIVDTTIAGTGSDSGLDMTTGKHFYILDANITAGVQTNIGHGVDRVYINGHTGATVILKNTSGRVICMNLTTSPIELSEQASAGIRGNDSQGNPSELANDVLGEYCTYELEYMNVGTINNNSSGLGTITTEIFSDPIGDFDVSMFVV